MDSITKTKLTIEQINMMTKQAFSIVKGQMFSLKGH
jgi:hypothetical protein